METEDLTEFREIPGYEGLYSVNLINQVKSHDRWVDNKDGKMFVAGRILKNLIHKDGHLNVKLYKDGIRNNTSIHVLVALAWNLPKKETDNCVEHKDDNPQHNHYSNLMWSTQSNNIINSHYRSKNRGKTGIKPILQYDLNGNFIKRHLSLSNAAIELGGTKSSILHNLKGRNSIGLGFIWKYEPLI